MGTERGRDLIHPELWAVIWQERARRLLAEGKGVVVDDCRFPNEVAAIKALGGYVIRIRTSGHDSPGACHSSERQTLPFDASIFNDGQDCEAFYSRIEAALLQLGG